jgi:hypothetical protein
VWTRQCRCRRGAPAAVLRSQPPLYGSAGRPDVRLLDRRSGHLPIPGAAMGRPPRITDRTAPFVLFGLGINDSSRPPDSAKPDSLRAEEARRQASPTHDTEV